MTKELINPNLHVVLVHFPLALFLGGLAIEVCSFMYRRSSVRIAGRWMILLGALSSIPTAMSGAYALADVARRSLPPGETPYQPWHGVIRATNLYDGKTGPDDKEGDQWRLIERHIWVQGPATALAALTVVVALGCSDGWRRRLYLPLLALLLAAGAMMVWGAWAGGEMVYRFGTAVRLPAPADPPPSATPARTPPPASASATSPRPTSASAAGSPASGISPDGSAIPAAAVLAAATQPAAVASTQPATRPVPLPPPPATAPAIPTTIPPLIPPLPEVPAATRPAAIAPTTLPAAGPATRADATTQPAERTDTGGAGTVRGGASPATVPSATPVEHATRSAIAASSASTRPSQPAAYYISPLEVHVILAGCAIAVALAAIGLSFRAAGVGDRVKAEAEAEVLREQSDDPTRRRATPDDVAMLRSFKPAAAMYVDAPERVPAGRWWLLALLAVLVTSLAGWWYLAGTSEAFDRAKSERRSVFVVLWEQVRSNPPADVPRSAATAEGPSPSWLTRRLAHVAGAGSIALLAIVLAALARWGRRARFMRWLCTLLLLGVVAAQVWVGLLLLFDTPAGSIYRYHRPPPAQPKAPSGQTIAVAE